MLDIDEINRRKFRIFEIGLLKKQKLADRKSLSNFLPFFPVMRQIIMIKNNRVFFIFFRHLRIKSDYFRIGWQVIVNIYFSYRFRPPQSVDGRFLQKNILEKFFHPTPLIKS